MYFFKYQNEGGHQWPQPYRIGEERRHLRGLVEEKHVNICYELHVRQMSYMLNVTEALVNLGRHCFGHLTGTETKDF